MKATKDNRADRQPQSPRDIKTWQHVIDRWATTSGVLLKAKADDMERTKTRRTMGWDIERCEMIPTVVPAKKYCVLLRTARGDLCCSPLAVIRGRPPRVRLKSAMAGETVVARYFGKLSWPSKMLWKLNHFRALRSDLKVVSNPGLGRAYILIHKYTTEVRHHS